jgi:TRAP transporter TAXI family solute receptor
MPRPTNVAGTIAVLLLVAALATPAALAAKAAVPSPEAIVVNRGVVELETGSSAGISVRIAEDLASVVNDGATRRVVPAVGQGSLGNVIDLKLLRGIDMAILQVDILDYAREQKLFAGIDTSISYITKLYNEEFHLLARPEIKSIADLANRKVNVDLRDSGTAITAMRLFDLVKLTVTPVNDVQDVALEKLRNGEIAALAFVAGKPAPLFCDLKGGDGLHFLAFPFSSAVTAGYVPTRLTATDYPRLVPQDQAVETVAVAAVLVVASLQQAPDRYRNVANFVDAFFTGFQSLLEPGHHPKWQEVNLAAEVPGWRRFPPAEQWLQRNLQVVKAPNPEELLSMFARFVDERRQSTGGTPMTQQEKYDLFQQYQGWQSGQPR